MAEVDDLSPSVLLTCLTWTEASLHLVSVAAFLPQDDKTSLVKQHRQKELELRRKTYRKVFHTLVLVLVHSCSSIYEYLLFS